MTFPDILVVLLLTIFALSGIHRGAVWDLLTTLGLVLGFGLTCYFRNDLLDLVVTLTRPGWQRQWAGGVVFLAFFLILYLGFAALGHHLHARIKKSPLRWVDHTLGLPAGLLKGVVLIGILVFSVEWLDAGGKVSSFLAESRIIRWGKHAAHDVIRWETPEQKKWV